MFDRLSSTFGTFWCLLMHDAPMWPIHGAYECRSCGRRFAAFHEAPVAGQGGRLDAGRRLAFERNGVA